MHVAFILVYFLVDLYVFYKIFTDLKKEEEEMLAGKCNTS